MNKASLSVPDLSKLGKKGACTIHVPSIKEGASNNDNDDNDNDDNDNDHNDNNDNNNTNKCNNDNNDSSSSNNYDNSNSSNIFQNRLSGLGFMRTDILYVS